LCGNGAHHGYNFPPKVPIIPDPEPFNNHTIKELPPTVQSFDPKYDLVYNSPNVFSPSLQPPGYSCEFCGNDTYYSQDGSLQVPWKQQYLDEMKHLINFEYRDEIKIAKLKQNFNGMSIEINKKEKLQQLEQLANLSTYPSKRFNLFCYDDDDEDFTIAVTPSLSTEEPDNSLSMGDEHLDTILATESDEFIYSEVMEIVIPEVGGIDIDILLTIQDDILFEKLLNVNLLIAKIEALNDNPTPSSDFMTKSSSTSLNSLLEETNTFDNSLPEFETFCFDVEEIIAPQYLLSLRNEDTIFDPGICNYILSRPDVSHRCGTFPRFKVLNESQMEIFSSTCSPMDIEFEDIWITITSLWSTFPNRPLHVDIGRCSCVIVKEISVDGLKGASLYTFYTNVIFSLSS
nr:tubby-like protein 8 [Tanacetum cinerariifolium]